MSLKGRVLIIQTLALSKLWYIGKVTGIPVSVIVTIEKILFKFLWGERKYEPIARKVMQNNIEEGGINFPDIKTKVKAFLVHRITEICIDDAKQWKGLFIYRLGFTVRQIIPEYALNTYAHTFKHTKIHEQIKEGLDKIKEETRDWKKETIKSMTVKLKEPNKTPNIEAKLPERDFQGTWAKIDKSSKINKRIDWNYLAAHRALPTGDWLKHRNLLIKPKCIFCKRDVESATHIFVECPGTQDIRREGKEIIKRITGKNIEMNEGNVIYFDDLEIWEERGMEIISIIKQSIWQVRTNFVYHNKEINPTVSLWRLFWTKIHYDFD